MKLTKCQMIALRACRVEIQSANNHLKEIMQEIGLDPAKEYVIDNDGEVKDGIRQDGERTGDTG